MELTVPSELQQSRRPARISVHAWGLLHPSHMEWTRDQRLLVSEFGRGQVMDVTEGGDYREASAFARGLRFPAGILPTADGRILVADTGRDAIFRYWCRRGRIASRTNVFSPVALRPY